MRGHEWEDALIVHSTERHVFAYVDPRAAFGSMPVFDPVELAKLPALPDERAELWSKVLRGWCPVLLGASRLLWGNLR